MIKNRLMALATGAAMTFAGSASAIVVTTTNDTTTLANTILGSGITINSATYNGAAGASGTFTGGTSSIGIDSGIILTTGSAADAVGPNNNGATTTDNGFAGSADLNALIPQTTYDASIFDIEFTSTGGDIFFNYVFASEEYNEWVNTSYNDVFAFFLDGTNIALVPGTSTAVSINNVNCGNPYGTGGNNCSFYNNNETGAYDIEYDGFTDVFTASFLGLSAGSHTLSLQIADAGDSVLDSAVFIQGGTLSDKPTPVPAPATLALMSLGLLGIGAMRRRKTA